MTTLSARQDKEYQIKYLFGMASYLIVSTLMISVAKMLMWFIPYFQTLFLFSVLAIAIYTISIACLNVSKITIDPDGVEVAKIFGGQVKINWVDINKIFFSSLGGGVWVIYHSSGQTRLRKFGFTYDQARMISEDLSSYCKKYSILVERL